MFDVVRNNPKIAQLILAVITVPFAFVGIEAYIRNGSGGADTVAKVGKQEITQAEFTNALRQQIDRMREQQGAAFDSATADSPVFRSSVLESLINQRLLDIAIKDGQLAISDAYLQDMIKSSPEFQENGQFSMRMYQLAVEQKGMTPQMFEAQQRGEIQKAALSFSLTESTKMPAVLASHWLALMQEERTVSAWRLDAKSKAADVKLAADAAKKYYDANLKRFEQPEQVKLEYVVLSADDLSAQAQVTEEDARKWYEEYKKTGDFAKDKRFSVPEKRHASQILVQIPEGAKDDVKAAAKKKAEDLLAKIKAAPGKFAVIAKESSDDKPTAEKGGDMGFVGRDETVKPFEDALFKLKPKEISGLVESQYGYHIIMLNEVQGGSVKSFDEAKSDALAEVRHQAAVKRYAELGSDFGSMVYEQPDGLKPIADKLGLKLQTTDWLTAASLPQGVLSTPKVRAMIFSAEAIKEKRNSEAIDLGHDSVLSFRVVDSKPARTKTFDEVKAEAEASAKLAEAAKQTKVDGEATVAKLKAGTAVDAKWSPSQAVQRMGEMSKDVRKAIFGVPAKQLPAYVGVADEDGYTVFRVEKVTEAKAEANDPRLKQISSGYATALGREDLRAYLQALRNKVGVKINEDKLNAKSGQ
ncbi:SurA N-terminal domain-containing protein [Uliginosibacterium gangwonense]|uniref:SurA N-terminal domain-containing protein n=1 Tax=Uliginosibacterium gangwonense TaxID=392736 RepID=UPI00039B0ECF|nr:SurA N-terminal domain-containing protein [Uliginosibacterium gangwonense]